MGIAALVLGIIAFLVSFIPGCGIILGFLPALIAIILGIVVLAKKKQKKGMAIAGLILSVLSIIIMIGMLILVGVGTMEAYDEATNSLSSIADEISTQANEIESSVSTKTSTEYQVGETYKDSSIAIKYVSLDQNFTDYSSYATVEEGHKIIKAEFEFENLSSTDKYVSSYDFNCYADGYDCESFWSVSDSSFSSTLSEGKKTKGSVYFEVPADAEEITMEYERSYLTDKKVVFVVK